MAKNADCEDEWLLQPVEESKQFHEDHSELVLGQMFIPPGDQHINL